LAQRRRRVFVVGYFGDWRPAAEVLFEPESLRRDPAPSREAGQKVAGTFKARANSGGWGSDVELAAGEYMQPVTARMVAFGEYVDDGTASAMKARDYKDATDLVAQPIAFQSVDHGADATENLSPTLRRHDPMAVAQPIGIFQDSEFGVQQYNTAGTLRAGRIPEHQMALQPIAAFKYTMGAKAHGIGYAEEQSPTLDTKPESNAVLQSMAVRRLTPIECERLQGFPDNYTNIPWRKADQSPDGPRYKALGNSMAVPVMHWIGRRISVYEDVMGKA